MKQILKSRIFAASVFFAFAVCLLYLLFGLGGDVGYVPAGDGAYIPGEQAAIDLRGFDFETSIARIDSGYMDFYPGRVIMPGELDNYVPVGRDLPGQPDYATARLRIIVPEGDYILLGKSPEYASHIFVNGGLKISFGRIDENGGNIFSTGAYDIAAHPADGVIEIVMQNAGVIREDTTFYPVYIGSHPNARYALMAGAVKQSVLIGIFTASALFFMGFYIFMPYVRGNLWFALISFVFALYMAVTGKLAVSLFPGIEYRFIFTVENGALIVINVFYLLLIQTLFGGSIPKTFVKIAITVNALLMAALLLLPVRVTSGYFWAHNAVIFTVALVSLACIARDIRKFNDEQIISAAGQAIFIYTGIAALLDVRGIVIYPGQIVPEISVFESTSLVVIGMIFYIISQMLALFIHNNRIAENERRLADKNASLEKLNAMKTELLGNISHEMKTPLTVISNMSQLALRRTDDGYIRAKMETAIAEVERMKVKTNHLLEATRLDDGRIEWDFGPADIRELINSTVGTYFRTLDEHSNTLIVEAAGNLPDVKADRRHLPGVIVNLIENAVHHTRGGKVIVRAEPAPGGDYVTVSVEDTGSGMTPGQRGRVFERFYTGDKSTGTGLGLYICRKVIDAHGGEIAIESEPGHGTKVWFTLPVWEGGL